MAPNLFVLRETIEAADLSTLDTIEAEERARPGRGRPTVLIMITERRRVLTEEA